MKSKLYLYLFIILTAVYVCFALGLPSNPQTLEKYNITQGQSRLLSLTIVVPLILVWFSALYGFLRFKAYATVIRDSREGKAFNQLANGLMVLAFSLPISASISSYLNYVAHQNTGLTPTATILKNYIALLFALVALFMVAKGAEGLLRTLRSKPVLVHPTYITIGFIMLSNFFTWLIIVRPSSNETGQVIYYLPDWLIITTLAIPYLLVWYMGALAAYRLYLYRDKVKGLIYQQAFTELARGIGVIVASSIFLQLLTTLSARLNRLDLTPILLIIYLLVVFYAVGYGLVARGAKRLKKIEEV